MIWNGAPGERSRTGYSIMFKAAKKYNTVCTNITDNRVIFERIYEAINDDEAEARAYLNCVKENNNSTDVAVSLIK